MVCRSLKDELREVGATQAELARRTGRTEATISRQLAGHLTLDPEVEAVARQLIREARAALYLRGARVLLRLAGQELHA